MWERLYNSSGHHPYSFWLLQASFLLVLAVARPRDRRVLWLCLGGTLVAALDAWLTQTASILPGGWQAPVAMFFVIVGDWRYWLVKEGERRSGIHAVLSSLTLALVVPLAIWLPKHLGWLAGRPLFLTYEVAAFSLAAWMARRRGFSPVTLLWLAIYGSWALADVLILSLGDLGYGLRLVPNTLYYGVFWPAVYAIAKRREAGH